MDDAARAARVVLVRHGQTDWSAAGRHTSDTDVELTRAGREQAEALRPLLAGHRFTLVLTSPRKRAVDTCRLAGLAGQAGLDADLAEWRYGDYEGLTSTQIDERRPGWSLWRDGCPAGEDAASVAERADRIIARCRSAGGDTALFAHGHVLRVLAARWIGCPPELGQALVLDTASISVLGSEHASAAVLRWNDTGARSGSS